MYPVSTNFRSILEGNNNSHWWYGNITLKDSRVIPFSNSQIAEGSGALTKKCSENTEIGIGTAYASKLDLSFKGNLGVKRYELFDGIIDLYAKIIHKANILTWADAESFTWGELAGNAWNNLANAEITYEFPMGQYIIKEAMQSAGNVKTTAYDFMILFDTDLPSPLPTGKKIPYDWLKTACTACGVTLGITRAETLKMPNGNRLLELANTSDQMKTWRDVIAEAAEVMGANVMIGRDGKLTVRRYGKYAVDGISSGFRYSSELSDYQSYYTGIYLSYKDGGVQDYQTNAATPSQDTGLSFDLGYNAFLQISDDGARHRAMKEIIDGHKGLAYIPFKVSMPFNPAFDLMDVIEFYSNQAASQDIAPITSIVFRCNDKMDISCGGQNPALQEAKSKETKALESAGGNSYNNDFWIVKNDAPDANSVTILADTATKIGEALFYAKEALSMFQVSYTATYKLEKTTLVESEVFVDEVSVYKTQENQWPGENRMTVTTGCEVSGTGSHKVEVYLTVKESTLDIGGGGVLMELDITENGIRVAADDGVYGYSKVTAVVTDDLAYYAQARQVDFDATEFISATVFDEGTYWTNAEQGPDISNFVICSYTPDLDCESEAKIITDYRDLCCRISEHTGDGANFNGRYFERTEDTPPLLFVNFSSISTYNSYGVISNHSDIPAHTGDYYGSLYAAGTLTVDGNTFYLFGMGGYWPLDRSGANYFVDGECVSFPSNGCYILIDYNTNTGTIQAINAATETAFRTVLAEFAQMG